MAIMKESNFEWTCYNPKNKRNQVKRQRTPIRAIKVLG